MKKGLVDANLLDTTYLMCQPLGYFTPDAGKQGFIDLPEFPFGLEPRICTRWDMHRYAKESWELGVRYVFTYYITSAMNLNYEMYLTTFLMPLNSLGISEDVVDLKPIIFEPFRR